MGNGVLAQLSGVRKNWRKYPVESGKFSFRIRECFVVVRLTSHPILWHNQRSERETIMLQAVIRTGNRQYLVKSGDVVDIEKIAGAPGEAVGFSDVLMVSDGEGEARIGAPVVEGAEVKAEIVAQKKGAKIIVFKFKRRKKYRRKAGHRQQYTAVRITDIKG